MAHYWERPTQAEADSNILAWLVFEHQEYIGDRYYTIVSPRPIDKRVMYARYQRMGDAGVPDFVEIHEAQPDINNLDNWFPRYDWQANRDTIVTD